MAGVAWALKKMVRPGSGCGHLVMCASNCKWVLIINGFVCLETDLFNHLKGLFFNRALDKFFECQYNMSYHVQKWLDIQMVGRTYQVKRRQMKKEGKKRWGEK